MQLLLVLSSVGALLAGWQLGVRSRLHPERYWKYLGAGAVLTGPFMFGGLTWFDEAFLLGLLAGNPPALRNGERSKPSKRWVLFWIFCLYAVVAGVRGLMYFAGGDDSGALQKTRWLLFFVLILGAALKCKQLVDSGVRPNGTARGIVLAGIAACLLYGLLGIAAFVTTGSFANTQYAQSALPTSEKMPYAVYGSTAYSLSVFVVVVAAALVCMGLGGKRDRTLGTSALLLIFAVQIAYNSRSGMLLVASSFLILLVWEASKGRLRQSTPLLAAVFLIIPVAVTAVGETDFDKVWNDLGRTLHISSETSDLQDIDRRIWISSSFNSLNDSDALHAVTGYGLRTSGFVIAPYVEEAFFLEAGRYKPGTDVATQALPALAVDLGYAGLTLFGLVAISAVIGALRFPSIGPLVVIAPLGLLMVTFTANNFDATVLWLTLMPLGLTYGLARDSWFASIEGVEESRSASPVTHRRSSWGSPKGMRVTSAPDVGKRL